MPQHKKISTFALLASSTAGIIGSGWLLGPLACARVAGPAALITWPIAGILMVIVAIPFVILARNIPTTGGTVRYFQMSYGHFAGFSISWISWLAWAAVAPIETMALIQYSTNYIPNLMTHGHDPVLTNIGLTTAIILTSLISTINGCGIHIYNKANYFILAFKVFIPTITVFLLLKDHFNPTNVLQNPNFMPYGLKSIAIALPIAGVIYSLIGFNPAVQLSAETKNPQKSIPIAIFGSLIFCTILYTLVQLAFIGALPKSSLADGWNHLSFAGSTGPFAGLLTIAGFVFFVKALYVDAVVSPFGTGMVQSLATSRLTVGMAENGYFPSCFSVRNKHGSPVNAIILNTIIGYIFFLPFPSWQHMVGFLVSCLSLGYIVGPLSLAALGKSNSNIKISQLARHLVCLSSFYICSLIIFWCGWSVIAKLTTVFITGYLILFIIFTYNKKTRNKLKNLQIKHGCWIVLYIAGISILSYLSSFGGTGLIKFGPDFFVIAIFVLITYLIANFLAPPVAKNLP